MISEVRAHLIEAVELRLRADVPVGIYLSGGIDSSALAGIATHLVREGAATMGSQGKGEMICCFSIGFDEESGFDESREESEAEPFNELMISSNSHRETNCGLAGCEVRQSAHGRS